MVSFISAERPQMAVVAVIFVMHTVKWSNEMVSVSVVFTRMCKQNYSLCDYVNVAQLIKLAITTSN